MVTRFAHEPTYLIDPGRTSERRRANVARFHRVERCSLVLSLAVVALGWYYLLTTPDSNVLLLLVAGIIAISGSVQARRCLTPVVCTVRSDHAEMLHLVAAYTPENVDRAHRIVWEISVQRRGAELVWRDERAPAEEGRPHEHERLVELHTLHAWAEQHAQRSCPPSDAHRTR